MTDRISISNVTQLAKLAKDHPGITSIPSLSFLNDKELTECNSCTGNKSKNLDQYHLRMNTALASLSENDKKRLKSILNTNKLCYYVRKPNGQLTAVCL